MTHGTRRERDGGGGRYEEALEAARNASKEGLPEDRLSAAYGRVHAELVAERPRRRRWIWLAGALAAAAAVLLAVWLKQDPPAGERPLPQIVAQRAAPSLWPLKILRRAGDATLNDKALGPELWQLGVEQKGALLELGVGARLDLKLGAAAQIALAGPAKLRLPDDGTPPRLEHGSAALSVEPHPTNKSFVLATGKQDVVVVGTRFAVQVISGVLQRCAVMEGTVELADAAVADAKGPTRRRRISSGGRYRRDGIDETKGGLDPLAVLGDDPFSQPWWQQRGVFLTIVSQPSGAEARIGHRAVGRTPLGLFWPRGEHRVTLTRSGYHALEKTLALVTGGNRHLALTLEPIASPPPSSRPRPRPRLRVGEETLWRRAHALLRKGQCGQLERTVRQLATPVSKSGARARAEILVAECKLRRGRKTHALALFEKVASKYPKTPSGQQARFEAAKLRAALGQRQRALAAFQRFVVDYPRNSLAAAAHFRSCELLIAINKPKRANGCLRRFRTAYPKAPRAKQSLLLLASLAERQSRWAAAADLYRQYLGGSPSASGRKQAMYRLVVCKSRGKLPGLQAAAKAYLQRYGQSKEAARVRASLEAR